MAKNNLVVRSNQVGPLTFTQADANLNALMYWSGAWAAPTVCGSQYCDPDTDVQFSSLSADSPQKFGIAQRAVSFQSGVDEWTIPVEVVEWNSIDPDIEEARYDDLMIVTYDGSTWSFAIAATPTYSYAMSWQAVGDCTVSVLADPDYDNSNGSVTVNVSYAACVTVMAADSYDVNEVVLHQGNLMVANKMTDEEPTLDAEDWDILARTAYGFGEMYISAPVGGFSITSAWSKLSQFNAIPIPGYGIDFDLANDNWSFSIGGVWSVRLQMYFSHDSSNSGRIIYLRLWDETDSIEIGSVPIGIARNQEATAITAELWGLVTDTKVQASHIYHWEIGNGDAVAVSSVQAMSTKANRVN